MADGDSPFGQPQVAANAPVTPPVAEAPLTNPEAAVSLGREFLAKHEAAMADRTKQVDNVFSKQQLTVDNMSRMLDDTTASLKRSREGRSNLPLMALGAGMLSSTGDFGQQLGAGVKAMVPQIERGRAEEDDYQYKLANLAMKRAGVENAPLQDKLAYLRALQVGDESTIRAIESGMIKAQGQTDKSGIAHDKIAQQKEAADQKAIYNALQEARRQTDAFYKDQTPDPDERDAETRRRFSEMARAMGVADASIAKFAPTMVAPGGPGVPGAPGTKPPVYKGGFRTPGDTPDDVAQAQQLGLPPKPVGYMYDAITSPTDKLKQFGTERGDWNKDTKDWDKAQSQNMSQLKNFDEMDMLLSKSPQSVGPKGGVIPNKWLPSTKEETQKLESLFSSNTIHGVPQGQGAISDYERTLFNKANPSMEFLPQVNKELIAIQRDIVKDQIAKRAFAESYFGHYKTTQGLTSAWDRYIQSDEGSAAITDPATGKLKKNPNRMSWQDYFRREGGVQGPTAPGRARGGKVDGPIRLGDEWSD